MGSCSVDCSRSGELGPGRSYLRGSDGFMCGLRAIVRGEVP